MWFRCCFKAAFIPMFAVTGVDQLNIPQVVHSRSQWLVQTSLHARRRASQWPVTFRIVGVPHFYEALCQWGVTQLWNKTRLIEVGVSLKGLCGDADGDVAIWWMPNGVWWSVESQRSVSSREPSEGCVYYWKTAAAEVGGGYPCAWGDGWGRRGRRTRHEIECGWRTEKSWAAGGGGGWRRWDRDGETGSGDRIRVRATDWPTRKTADVCLPKLCCGLNLHSLSQSQVNVYGEYFSSAVRRMKVKISRECSCNFMFCFFLKILSSSLADPISLHNTKCWINLTIVI